MKREVLLYGDTNGNSDMLYFTGLRIPDPFFAFTLKGKKCALINALEIGRARRSKKLDEVFDLTSIGAKESLRGDGTVAAHILKKAKVRALLVPRNFPAYQLEFFRGQGFDVEIAEGGIFPKREIKTKDELGEIATANLVAAAGFHVAEEMLRQAKIVKNKLIVDGEILTSEMLRTEIEKIAISLGADAMNTIVAAGDQACDPHEVGHGPIAPNSLIVIDIFPRLRDSGYFGDMTRTFLKGKASPAQKKLVETVLLAQEVALESVCAGVNGADIHAAVEEVFRRADYKTEMKRGVWSGFFHSTGHGLGLDVHEAPSLSVRDCVLRAGQVVTVEPGLYYRGLGGCRMEDNVAVRKDGAELLSEYHYEWIVE